ncbi:MAG TPA: hypothetical protein VFG03_18310, partial [Telluria sp.]|nr:hypothetical protein [Telluria sp.]
GSISAFAETAPHDPQIADVHVEIQKGGTTLFAGNALLSWQQVLTHNTVRELPMEIECDKSATVTGATTYHDGVRFELTGVTRGGVLHGQMGFAVYIPKAGQITPRSNGCIIRTVDTHKYASSGGQILQTGETTQTVVDDLIVRITLRAAYDEAPPDRPIDKFTPD